jgi:hypothetical protein
VDLDEVADELYEVPPDEFVALRKARQDEAKDDGDRALAKEIGALPKPSAAAWVSNLLVRRHRDEIESLVELGDLLREAQENLAGDQLRTLNTQRSQLLSALARQAAALAREQGRPVSSSVAGQVEETLRAAMADPEAGQALLSGRLTSPMSYSGLGTTVLRPDLRLVHPPRSAATRPERPKRETPRRAADAGERRRQREEEQRRAAEEQRCRELAEARRQAEDATAEAEEAEEAAETARVRAGELGERQAELEARIDRLTHELARTREEVSGVNAELSRAQRRRQTAARRAAEAAAARDRALARVAELGDE